MKTVDIYTTPQCGFCKALKAKLDEKNIPYTSHDVTASEKDLADMLNLSGGAMSVPVTVLNKDKADQQVLLGYPNAVKALQLEKKAEEETEQKDIATLTCPKCGHKQEGEIPTTHACRFMFVKVAKKPSRHKVRIAAFSVPMQTSNVRSRKKVETAKTVFAVFKIRCFGLRAFTPLIPLCPSPKTEKQKQNRILFKSNFFQKLKENMYII